DQGVGDGLRPPLGQTQVVGVAADRVGVAVDRHAHVWILLQYAGRVADLGLPFGRQIGLVEGKVRPRDVLDVGTLGKRWRWRRRRWRLHRLLADEVPDDHADQATRGEADAGACGLLTVRDRLLPDLRFAEPAAECTEAGAGQEGSYLAGSRMLPHVSAS